MNAKIQKWLKDRYPLHFAGWKKGKYSQVILCTFEDWEKGKAKVHEAPGVKVERLFDEDGPGSGLILYALPPSEYKKISEQKKRLADEYIAHEIEWWKGAFRAGCIASKDPEWYLDKEIERVTEALEDPEKGFFDSVTGYQLAIGATYSKTSDKPHPDDEGKTFKNELAYYHYYTWKAPHKRVKYWDDLDLKRYREWQERGRQFNTPSMGCDARILAQYREHLKEWKESPPFASKAGPEAEPLPAVEDLDKPKTDNLTTWQRCMYYRYLLEGGATTPFSNDRPKEEAYKELAKRHGKRWEHWRNIWGETTKLRRKHESKRKKEGLKKVLELLEEYPEAHRICEMELKNAGIL